MSYFQGYLIKFTKTGRLFPHELIAKDTYQSTPLQRTSPNYKTKVTFQTLDDLSLSDMQTIRNLINSAYDNAQQRKLRVTYWDDKLLNYRTMTAYIPDITYQPAKISSNDIKYAPVTFTFIEY